jgi:hypothetical protein
MRFDEAVRCVEFSSIQERTVGQPRQITREMSA